MIYKAYSLEKSFGQYLLHKLTADNRIKRSEWYIAHYVFAKNILLLSDRQVLFVNKDTLEKKWKLALKSNILIECKTNHRRYSESRKNKGQSTISS